MELQIEPSFTRSQTVPQEEMALRAAKYIGDGRLEVGDLDVPHPAAGEAVIRVAYNGICGTDLHIVQGHMDQRVVTPASSPSRCAVSGAWIRSPGSR